jgi:hypothetical protein
MFYYSKLISHTIFEQKTKLRKGCISYFKSNGNHGLIVKKIKEEMNEQSIRKKQLAKKRPTMNTNAISNFLGAMDPNKKDNVHQKDFIKNLGLLVIKNHLPI